MKQSRTLVVPALFLLASTLVAEPLRLHTRRQVETAPRSGDWKNEEKVANWDPKKTAIIICDMWDKHWCQGATERVGEMAPRMNEVVRAARNKGVFIIHSPSDTMKFYEATPQRKLAQSAPVAQPPVPLQNWCKLDPAREAPLPIDDSDGGCDESPQCKNDRAWSRQIATIEIADGDAITDSTEAYNLLQQRGIDNVIVMGVHANMCVLGRPFSIRQMVGVGKNVVLMRDMTDTMYNSRSRPFVNHFRGTDLILQHIERYWCPSITSVDFIGGKPFRFSKDPDLSASSAGNYAAPATNGSQAGPLSPEDSAASFTTFEDLQIEQVLAEPIVRQPVHLSWDERGRLWVVQYLQYPAPAGLTIMSKDQFWRAVYDKVPPPPPHHFKGEDKITIHEDTDGDGKFDKHTTFVEGLNIVTAVEHGRGGVWVLNPPYLLFFPDKNHDDVVDDNPVVHLAGFGLEDTHSVANSLRWGPDGWLYGAHGSTVTANIVRPGLDEKPIARIMGQAIWRYHPETRRFEVFAEGGGNAFGLEMDDQARIFSGHNGGNTRGFHYVQGGYLQKGFEKHGPLSNPYAFGYFKQMVNNDVERFTHTFVIYGGGALPERYKGNLFGAEPLQGRIVYSEVMRDGSSFKTRDQGHAVTTTDKYFKPVEIKTGPDGAIYIADWYDRQVTHTRNYEGNIDKSNGRIYRLRAKGAAPRRAPRSDVLARLADPNRTIRQTALRQIADVKEKNLAAELKRRCLENSGQSALEYLWAYNLTASLDDVSALEFLDHRDPFVRLWTIRLLGDAQHLTQAVQDKVLALSRVEPHVEVRSQLASTAKRLPASQSLPLLKNLVARNEDASDIHIPLLLWWALEAKAESDRDAVLSFFQDRELWDLPVVRGAILDRIMRRYAMAGSQNDLRACARLLQMAPDNEKARQLLAAFEKAYEGRSVGVLPRELRDAIAKAGGGSMTLSIRQGDQNAAAEALKLIQDPATAKQKRGELIQIFGEVRYDPAVPVLLKFAAKEKDAINALAVYDHSAIPAGLIQLIPALPKDAQLAAFNVLSSRSAWSAALVQAVEQGSLKRQQIPAEIVDKLRADESLASAVEQAFGPKPTLDKAALDAKLGSLAATIRNGSGSPFEGYKNFQLACSTCHKLFGEGGQIGPDLTSFKRDDLETMLMSIVNPSGEIREGYENVLIETKDGRSLSGFIAEKYEDSVVLRDLAGETTVIAKKDLVSLKSAGRSLMPEGLLDAFNDQQLRDLFAYLRSTQPLVKQR